MSITESNKKTIGDVYALIQQVNANIEKQIEKLDNEVKSIKTVVELELGEIRNKVHAVGKGNFELKIRLETVERQLKKHNLVIYGVKEQENESQDYLLCSIGNIVREKLRIEINKTEFNNIYRLGMNKSRTRPILVSFVSQIKRQEILWNSQKLKGSRIYIAEDLIEKDQQERKILVDNLKESRRRNKLATIKGRKLIIEGNVYTAEDLKDYTQGDTNFNFSPPPERKARVNQLLP
ncbi:hypothetical protein JTB14_012354 [Gonioctena quinquepunctata]|nr:hypothetical protein JTB14_012354 [Gonioctena quinquepunctata]